MIVTGNVKDFPASQLEQFNLSAQTPDEFLLNQLDLEPQPVMELLRSQAADLRNPPLELDELLAILEKRSRGICSRGFKATLAGVGVDSSRASWIYRLDRPRFSRR